MILQLHLLSSVEEALELALIRNECRFLLTNNQQEISPVAQTQWFNEVYTQQKPQNYWVWLLRELQNSPPQQNRPFEPLCRSTAEPYSLEYVLGGNAVSRIIGYFAAKEADEGIYITEGLLERMRGIGAGTFMLNSMLSMEFFKGRPLYADIFNHNSPSIRLHEKFGFKEFQKINDKVTRFVLMDNPC